jgi:hypothetical protein
MKLYIHPRIHRKHPELSDDDIKTAFNSIFRHIHREAGECVGIGMDSKQRLVELVFKECEDSIIIYHALTPPTTKVMKTLGMVR